MNPMMLMQILGMAGSAVQGLAGGGQQPQLKAPVPPPLTPIAGGNLGALLDPMSQQNPMLLQPPGFGPRY